MILTFLIKLTAALGLVRFLMAMAIYIPLERLAPFRKQHPILREGWLTDLANFFFNGLLTAVIFHFWNRWVGRPGWMKPLALNLAGQSIFVQVIATVGVGSFIYYWGHRAEHSIPLLWRFHSVHHSIERLDWLATFRGHVYDSCWSTALVAMAMAFLGLSEPTAMWFVVYRFLEGQIEHSNVRVPLGFLKWVIPSPWFHQWHHAMDAEALNKNFSPYPLWDVLFGTAYMPADRVPERFGTDTPVPTQYLGQLAYPFGLASQAERLQRWAGSLLIRPRPAL